MMRRDFLILFMFIWTAAGGWAADGVSIQCPSPDGRFALRIADPAAADSSEFKVELIEKASGKVISGRQDKDPS